MMVLAVVGIAVMCALLYKIKETLETLDRRVSSIEEHLTD